MPAGRVDVDDGKSAPLLAPRREASFMLVTTPSRTPPIADSNGSATGEPSSHLWKQGATDCGLLPNAARSFIGD